MHPTTVIQFWFEETEPKQRFAKSDAFDALVKDRFMSTYWSVVKGETEEWRETPEGRLAEILVLDQFARNIFRDLPQAFMHDPLALALAQEMVRRGDDRVLSEELRQFAYMPYMHSESPRVHERAHMLFSSLGGEALEYEKKHKVIIDRFGRYPHRNAVLGRDSAEEELEFLKTHSGF